VHIARGPAREFRDVTARREYRDGSKTTPAEFVRLGTLQSLVEARSGPHSESDTVRLHAPGRSPSPDVSPRRIRGKPDVDQCRELDVAVLLHTGDVRQRHGGRVRLQRHHVS